MSREQKALDGVRHAVPDDDIVAIALMYPRGTTVAQGVGSAIGGLAGSTNNMTGFGQAGGYMAGDALIRGTSGLPPSIILAVSATKVHALGRNSTAPFGHWDNLSRVASFDRSTLRVEHHRSGALVSVTLTDTTTGSDLALEAKPIGNMGVSDVLDLLDAPPNNPS